MHSPVWLVTLFLGATAVSSVAAPAASATPAASVLPLGTAVPDVATLQLAIRQGHGTDLSRETIVTDATEGGVAGSIVSYRDGSDERTVEKTGPLEEERGSLHGVDWHENANGEVTLNAPDPGLATGERTTETVERAPAPFDAFVLVRTSRRGFVVRRTVDRQTGHVLRVESIRPSGDSVTSYDDFRTTDGETRPWTWTFRDGHREDDADYAIARIDTGPVAATDLAIPSGRTFVTFPDGVSSVTLPATEHDGKFIVRVTIAGRGLDFVLDTGASQIVIDETVAKQLDLPEISKSTNGSNAGRFVTTTTVVPEMRVGALTMRDVAISTIPNLQDEEPGDYRAVGLLGFDFIADCKLVLDYAGGTVTAYERHAALPPPADTTGFVLPVRLGDQTPHASVAINGALGERFLLDTGASSTLIVFDYFARRHPEALVDDAGANRSPVPFLGVGGEFQAQPYRLRSVLLGSVNFADFTAYRVLPNAAYESRNDGLLGSDFLSLFTVDLDYPDGAVGFYLNKTGQAGIVK